MEDYGFEYSEEEPEEQDVDIENQYYNSKGNSPEFQYVCFSIANCNSPCINFHWYSLV